MPIKTEQKYTADVLLWEVEPRFTRQSVTFRNPGATASFVIGQTLKLNSTKYEPADSTTAAAILLRNLDDVPGSSDVLEVPVLIRGPALVNVDELEILDPGSNKAGQLAALLALGIRTVKEPENQEEAV